MAMTKKDFEMLASCFSDISAHALTHREKQLVCRLATMINNRCKAQSYTFDEQRFLAACRLPKVEGFNC
jgi:hypothetical protein